MTLLHGVSKCIFRISVKLPNKGHSTLCPGKVLLDVWKETVAFSSKGVSAHVGEGDTFFPGNVWNHLPSDAALRPRRPEPSIAAL
jgi:hypothetical protein